MRARSDGARAPRLVCYQCFKPQVACMCDSIKKAANQTGIIILQHSREQFQSIGTARIVRLALAKVHVEPCSPRADGSAIRTQLPAQTALLYPAVGARELGALPVEERPRHPILICRTWSRSTSERIGCGARRCGVDLQPRPTFPATLQLT